MIAEWLLTKAIQLAFAFALVVGLLAAVPLGLLLVLAMVTGAWQKAEERTP